MPNTVNLTTWTSDVSNGASADSFDLLLTKYSGEVLAAYEEFNVFLPLVRSRTLSGTNSAQFPTLWKTGSEYHEAGSEIVAQDIESSARTLYLDDRPLVSAYEVDDIQAQMAHFDSRQELATQAARELAKQRDKQIALLLLNASAGAAVGSIPGGTSYSHANLGTADNDGVGKLLEFIEDASVRFDENDVPDDGKRNVAIKSDMWHRMKAMGVPQDAADVTAGVTPVFANQQIAGSQVNIAQSMPRSAPLMFEGFKIWRSNHLPNGTNVTTGPSKYQFDATKTKGIIWHSDAVGVLELEGVSVDSEYSARTRSTFFSTAQLTGGGTLRPYCAIELATP